MLTDSDVMEPPPASRDVHLALLELKLAALERRQRTFLRDAMIFIALALVAFPPLLAWMAPWHGMPSILALSVLAAALAVGFPAWRRERREVRALAQRRQQIYLSLRPDVFSP